MRRTTLLFCYANIHSLPKFEYLLQHPLVDPKQSIAFIDLDNTAWVTTGIRLPTSDQSQYACRQQSGYGSELWFAAMVAHIQKQPTKLFHSLFSNLLIEYATAQRYAIQTPTQPAVPETLSALKKRGALIFGLTARRYCLAQSTDQHLSALGIYFSCTTRSDHPIVLDNTTVVWRGVIYSGGAPSGKGCCVNAFLDHPSIQQLTEERQHMMVVDDKRDHCASIQKALTQRGLFSRVFHFTHAEKHFPLADQNTLDTDRKKLLEFLMHRGENPGYTI